MTSNFKQAFKIEANLRTTLGSPESRRSRKAGNTPAVIHNKDGENLNILLNSRELRREYYKGNIGTTVIEIDLDGKTITAIAHKIEIDPVTDHPIHIDFLPFKGKEEVRVKAKVKFTGREKSAGIKKGGFLHIATRKVEVVCNPAEIPEFVEVDISKLRVGSKIRSTDLILPENVKLTNRNLFNVASILGRGAKSEEDGVEGEADTAVVPAAEAEKAAEEKK
ncbi:MAG: large subunit ribosomal protein L25 [Lentimonas sp.]|jgi:large subunit ribosomal protein L25